MMSTFIEPPPSIIGFLDHPAHLRNPLPETRKPQSAGWGKGLTGLEAKAMVRLWSIVGT